MSPIDAVVLCYGYERHTTAIHLDRALRRLVNVVTVGPGHPPQEVPDGCPLVWVESGATWLPPLPVLLERPTLGWLIDTHVRLGWRLRVAGAFDHACFAQKDAADQCRSERLSSTWLPLAAPADLCSPGPPLSDREFDVAFVGSVRPRDFRAELLRVMRQRFRVAPVGGFQTPEEMMALYSRSRVIINPPRGFDLNMRVFEALGARALLVTGPAHGLGALIPEDVVAIVERREPLAWVRAVSRLLADQTAQNRADRGYDHVANRHTYDHRAQDVLRLLASAARSASPRSKAVAYGAGVARHGQARELVAAFPEMGAAAATRCLLELVGWRTTLAAHRVAQRR